VFAKRIKIRVRSTKGVWDGSGCKESKDLGSYMKELQDTWIDLKITGNPKGLDAKQPRASSSSGQMREQGGVAAYPAKFPALRRPRSSGAAQNGKRRSLGSQGVVWTSLGPLPRWVPGPTTRWAPGTTRLALHGTCWREAQGLQRRSTRIGSCTCPALYRGLLDVLD
jgi:hypothetical protein